MSGTNFPKWVDVWGTARLQATRRRGDRGRDTGGPPRPAMVRPLGEQPSALRAGHYLPATLLRGEEVPLGNKKKTPKSIHGSMPALHAEVPLMCSGGVEKKNNQTKKPHFSTLRRFYIPGIPFPTGNAGPVKTRLAGRHPAEDSRKPACPSCPFVLSPCPRALPHAFGGSRCFNSLRVEITECHMLNTTLPPEKKKGRVEEGGKKKKFFSYSLPFFC